MAADVDFRSGDGAMPDRRAIARWSVARQWHRVRHFYRRVESLTMPGRLPAYNDPALRVTHWSTRDIAATRRFAVWLERPLPSLARLFDVRAIGAFETAVDEVPLGETSLQFAEGTGRHYIRTAQRIAADAIDLVGICFLQTGTLDGATDRGAINAGPGDILLLDLAQPSRHTLTTAISVQWAVPRGLAERHFGAVADLHGLVIDAGPARLAVDHVLAVRRALPTLSVGQGARLARNMLDLLALILKRGAVAEAPSRSVSSARRAAERFIEDRLHDKSLDAAALSAHLDITRGALFRLFKDKGGYQAYTRGRRLERVREALDDRANAMSLAALADHWGFSDASHLGRLFRDRFGMTPSIYRKKPVNFKRYERAFRS